MNKTSAELGSFLRAQRERLGLTQADVALKMGYSSPQFVSNWERGIAPPPYVRLKELISILKIDKKMCVDLMTAAYRSEIESHFNSRRKPRDLD